MTPTQDDLFQQHIMQTVLDALTGDYTAAVVDGIPVLVTLGGEVLAKILTPEDADYEKLVVYFNGLSDGELRDYLKSNGAAGGLQQPADRGQSEG